MKIEAKVKIKIDSFTAVPYKPRPRVKTRGIGTLRTYSIHPRDKSRGFLRGGVNNLPADYGHLHLAVDNLLWRQGSWVPIQYHEVSQLALL